MSLLEKELAANHANFFADWTAQASANWTVLSNLSVYKESYRRIASLQALKGSIIEPHYGSSAAFFFEAHNDALVSHVFASLGAWRSALQALRSCIENVLCAVYYKDHPVELQLWAQGDFFLGFKELSRYLEKHPALKGLGTISGLEGLGSEYALLSKAVHGSATNFRMTEKASAVLLWSTEAQRASMWATRERRTLECLCLLVVCLHRSEFQGTRKTPVRELLSFAISATRRSDLQKLLKITIPNP
jgi:hypothetical protein